MTRIKTVLFDLDGTLVDTAPDMAAALDKLCREQDQLLIPYYKVRPVVSNGSVALIKLAFGNDIDEDELNRLKQRYLDIYNENIATHSKVFDEIENILAYFDDNNINWGVVTNKPGWLTIPLMESLQLKDKAACIVSGDSTENRKPHPEPIYHACKLAGSEPEECVYVGDARRDIEAGKNAGMKTFIAMYGYIEEHERPDEWGADHLIQKPSDLIQYL